MGVKRYAVLTAILAILLIFAGAVYADEEPRYSVEGVYNAKTKSYTAEIYLYTTEYLSTGSFGMEYNFDTSLETFFELNTAYFAKQIPNALQKYFIKSDDGKYMDKLSDNQIFLQWGMLDVDIEQLTGKIPFATLTVKGVEPDEDGNPLNWDSKTIHQLVWTDTDMSRDELFSETIDDIDLSAEIWQATSEEERLADTTLQMGYYQGYAADREVESLFDKWIDIGFVYTSESDEYARIKGSMHGYNPKFPTEVTAYLYKDGEWAVVDNTKITNENYTIYADGQVDGEYTVRAPEPGEYVIFIRKTTHLSSLIYVTVPEDAARVEVQETANLICGDIDQDGFIKLPDRICLMRFLNYQISDDEVSDKFKEADLNGDGKVNLFDLSILKQNMQKTY